MIPRSSATSYAAAVPERLATLPVEEVELGLEHRIGNLGEIRA